MVKQLILPIVATLAGLLAGVTILFVGGMMALVCAEEKLSEE